jgi:hypothetical protein
MASLVTACETRDRRDSGTPLRGCVPSCPTSVAGTNVPSCPVSVPCPGVCASQCSPMFVRAKMFASCLGGASMDVRQPDITRALLASKEAIPNHREFSHSPPRGASPEPAPAIRTLGRQGERLGSHQ